MATPSFFAASSIGVIVGRDLVGDALIKLPFLRALRAAYPQARITWITAQGPTAYSGALLGVTRPLIDRIFEQPDWLATALNPHPRSAPQGGLFFDILIDTRNRWREALFARKSVPHRLFLAPALRFLFSDRRPSLFQRRPRHMVGRLLQLVELVAGYAPSATGRLPVPPDTLAKAQRILPPGPVYVGLAPGGREWHQGMAALSVRTGRRRAGGQGPRAGLSVGAAGAGLVRFAGRRRARRAVSVAGL